MKEEWPTTMYEGTMIDIDVVADVVVAAADVCC